MKIKTSLIGALLCLLAQPALAGPITYTLDDLGGGQWQYNYTFDNTFAFPVDAFTIFFDLGVYENLFVFASPEDWDSFVAQPDGGIPDDGFFDTFAEIASLDPGDMVSGFSVMFDFLGGGTPGTQFFEVYDPFSCDDFGCEVLADGRTMADGQVGVPEPSTLWLFSTALLLSGFASRKRLLLIN